MSTQSHGGCLTTFTDEDSFQSRRSAHVASRGSHGRLLLQAAADVLQRRTSAQLFHRRFLEDRMPLHDARRSRTHKLKARKLISCSSAPAWSS